MYTSSELQINFKSVKVDLLPDLRINADFFFLKKNIPLKDAAVTSISRKLTHSLHFTAYLSMLMLTYSTYFVI